MTQKDLKCPPMLGFFIYLLLAAFSASAHCCSIKEGLRLSRAQSPQGLLGPYAKQSCTDEGANGHSPGVPTARLALEDLEQLDTRPLGLHTVVGQRGCPHYVNDSWGFPCCVCTVKEEGGWNFQFPMKPSEPLSVPPAVY